MEVFVDDRRVEDEQSGEQTLADALRHVQSSRCPPGRLVVKLRCDGREVLGDAMESTLRKKAATVTKLEVFTSTRNALVNDAMNQASASLQETEDACQRVAELLTEGKTKDGMNTLSECLRIWQQIHLAVTHSITMLGIDIEHALIQDEPMAEIIGKPKEILVQIRDALTRQDHVLLADLLQFEFRDVTDQWYAIIARIREEADEGPQKIKG